MAAAVKAIRNNKQKAAILEVFEKYDADGSGAIDKDELTDALADLGMVVNGAQAKKVMNRYLPEGSAETELNKQQFLRLVADLRRKQRSMSGGESGGSEVGTPCGPLCGLCTRLPEWKYKEKALQVYTNKYMQLFVAFLILFNFAVNVYEKEIDPFPAELQRYGDVWENFDRFFNVIFLFELLLNAWSCGGPYRTFWKSGWNNFDFLVVFVGILLMSGAVPPDNPLSNLKMMRAFRVFRLFKRIKSLNKVIMALLKAIPGVSNAFIIMVIFMMIYAILAVEYFAQLGQGCEGREEAGGPDGKCFGLAPYNTFITFNDDGSNQTLSAETARGFAFGYEYFGTFTRALFTLFQVMTTESWSEAIARPLLFGLFKENAILVSFFFVSFILLMQIVLTNVVVAVLLDKFVEDDPGAKENEGPPKEIDASDFLGGDASEDESHGGSDTASPDASMARGKIDPAVRTAFKRFDKNGNGSMDVGELKAVLTYLGVNADTAQVGQVLKKFDADRTGSIDLVEFSALVNDVMAKLSDDFNTPGPAYRANINSAETGFSLGSLMGFGAHERSDGSGAGGASAQDVREAVREAMREMSSEFRGSLNGVLDDVRLSLAATHARLDDLDRKVSAIVLEHERVRQVEGRNMSA